METKDALLSFSVLAHHLTENDDCVHTPTPIPTPTRPRKYTISICLSLSSRHLHVQESHDTESDDTFY